MTSLPADPVDTHDPAGMAAWLRQRKEACLEFYQLTDDAQRLHYLQRWQLNVLPHLAFRFGQAAEMIEQLVAECEHLRGQVPNTPADDVPAVRECGCVMICKREKLKPGERCANDRGEQLRP